VQIVGNEQPRYLIRLQSDAIGNCKKCDVALRRLATDIGLYSLAASTNYLLGVFIPIVVLSQVEPKDSPQTSLGRLYSLATAHRRRTLDHWLSQWPSVAAPIAERLEAGDIASNRSLSFRDVRSFRSNGFAGHEMPRVLCQDLWLQCPVLEKLRRKFRKVTCDPGSRQPAKTYIRQQSVQRMSKLVKYYPDATHA
jgi:hypothetical protein